MVFEKFIEIAVKGIIMTYVLFLLFLASFVVVFGVRAIANKIRSMKKGATKNDRTS